MITNIMAWTFRRKIRVAPGVHINLSKSGISMSVGPKGAKMTVGPNGTYLHTGIPGTGLYNRQKIAPSPQSGITSVSTSKTYSSHKNRGCLNFFMWVLCIFTGMMTIGGIMNIVDAGENPQATNREYNRLNGIENTYTQPESTNHQEDTELPETLDSPQDNCVYLTVVTAFFILSLIWLVRRYSTVAADSATSIEEIRSLISNTENPLKKSILNNQLGFLIRQDADRRIKPLVDKLSKKAAKNTKYAERFRVYDELYKSAIAESDSLISDVGEELSNAEKRAYAGFCEAFKTFGSCSKVWKILFSVRNTELKSSAYTNVKKSSITLKVNIFDKLSCFGEIPVFPISDGRSVCFYPNFIVVGRTISDFEVLPIDGVNLTYSPTRFIEDGIRPADAEQVATTYKYINKNGSPDRRYSYNPVMPVLLYGDITLRPYGDTFQVSNNDAAMRLEQAFRAWKLSASVNKKMVETADCISPQPSPTVRMHDVSNNTKTGGDSSPAGVLLGCGNGAPAKYDSLFAEIARDAVSSGQIATSYIQRKYEVGFNRAGRIMTQLECAGIVGPQVGAKQREIKIHDIPSLEAKLQELGLS